MTKILYTLLACLPLMAVANDFQSFNCELFVNGIQLERERNSYKAHLYLESFLPTATTIESVEFHHIIQGDHNVPYIKGEWFEVPLEVRGPRSFTMTIELSNPYFSMETSGVFVLKTSNDRIWLNPNNDQNSNFVFNRGLLEILVSKIGKMANFNSPVFSTLESDLVAFNPKGCHL